ncbi:MAG TPA: glycoside hydrolase family 172 protein, partial [Verrucomicrobiae bacterium]|nr:glycoside hydrolase family 172 protein [Verrucomicrobiae bacterium]
RAATLPYQIKGILGFRSWHKTFYSRVMLTTTNRPGFARLLAVAALAASSLYLNASDETPNPATDLYQMPSQSLQSRWFTAENPKGLKGQGGQARFGRKGAPAIGVAAGKTLVMADIQGSGTIHRIWGTLWHFTPEALPGMKIEMYWDGAKTPAVQAPLGDFFCESLGHMVPLQNACFYSPEGRSFNCLIPMPFRRSAKIVLVNESGADNGIYYEVDATEGDKHDRSMLYFHSYWQRENPTTLRQDMTILPRVEGKGRFLGCNVGARLNHSTTNFWWGEGEVKVYLDGDTQFPTLCGTGTEDYIGDGYGQNVFCAPFSGDQYIAPAKDAYEFYRLHIPDPIWFHKDIRVTIQNMGGPGYKAMLADMDKDPSLKFMKAGDGTEYYTRAELEAHPKRSNVMERSDDYCATAYWFMNTPESELPPLAPVAERLKDLQ